MATERVVPGKGVVRGPDGTGMATSAVTILPPTWEAGLVSVLVPCWGQLEYTRRCVNALLRFSRMPYELIFVDVASLDGSAEFLDGVAAAAPVRVEVVHAASDTAFREAVHEALARVRGEFVAWLSNDVIVTDGWLQQLVALAGMNVTVGAVGPMSNVAPVGQRVERVAYRLGVRARGEAPASPTGCERQDVEAVNQFAQRWREEHKGQWVEAERLAGFCLLVKRSVLRTVPWFEPKGEPGDFDAGSFSLRVINAGYRLARCSDLFVHHFGSRPRLW